MFREGFVLALKLLLQSGDPLFLRVGGPSREGLERRGVVLEVLFLPAELGGMNAVLDAQIWDGEVFEEMEWGMGTFYEAVRRLRVFLAMGEPPIGNLAYSGRPFSHSV